MEQFSYFASMFAGATFGIMAVVVPIGLTLFVGWKVYQEWITRQWNKKSEKYMQEQLQDMQNSTENSDNLL